MAPEFELIRKAIYSLACETWGCGGDRCCCSGVEAFECKSGTTVDEMARAVALALDIPSQITPAQEP